MKYLATALLLVTINVAAKSFLPSSFSANIEESFKSHSGKLKKNFGKVDYLYPGNIRFEYTSPDPSLFVSNPKKSWYYVPPFVEGEPGQVTVQSSSKLPLTKLLDSIKDGIEGSKLFIAEYSGKDLSLSFRPDTQKEMSLKSAVLHGKKNAREFTKMTDIESLTLVHADGKTVTLRFIDLKENVKFSEGHFVFQVPPKTKVTNN